MQSILCRLIIVALRNEKGSYSYPLSTHTKSAIVALRNEKGSYSPILSNV